MDNAITMETKELIALLGNIDGQLELHEKAKTGEKQSMIDFVRFCVLRKVFSNKELNDEQKISAFENLMGMIVLKAMELDNGR